MSPPTVYLDNAATTPIAADVKEAMLPFLEAEFANPSSRHVLGVRVAEAIGEARARVARAVGAKPENVLFTSGGTEANNLGVLGSARALRRHGRHVLVGPTEHPSVRASANALAEEGFEVEEVPLTNGSIDLARLHEHVRPDTVLVAQMLVNNEFGTIYPVRRLARIVRAEAPNAAIHVDAVQALGKIDVSLGELSATSLSISAHKIHGPKGAGALVLSGEVTPRPLVFGGDQERGLRPGTESPAAIVGLGRAVELAAGARAEASARMTALREHLRVGLSDVPGARLLDPGGEEGVSPAIAAVLLPGPPAEVWLHHLEARGVMSSVGSACHAKKTTVSPALLALGLGEEEARRVLRLSFSGDTAEASVDAALEALSAVREELAVPR